MKTVDSSYNVHERRWEILYTNDGQSRTVYITEAMPTHVAIYWLVKLMKEIASDGC